MIRKIVKIDQEKCNGCGACASACQEGAIRMIDGKAVVTRDDYCDGLGNCLPACPTGAISIEEREALPFDEAAVKAAMAVKKSKSQDKSAPQHTNCPGSTAQKLGAAPAAAGCPGAAAKKLTLEAPHAGCPGSMAKSLTSAASPAHPAPSAAAVPDEERPSALSTWPVQIKLVPANAPYFAGADLLVAADCTAYAYARFHQDFIAGRVTLIGCPKLDAVDYADKLTQLLAQNDIRSVTVVRMEVPCCGGLEKAVRAALTACGKCIPWQVVTIGLRGSVTDRRP